MTSLVEIVAARTHPKEYLLHKYWSRKPSNVLSHFLSRLAPAGGTILDPFCGSGVSLLESLTLGFTAYGFDINPVAVLLSSVTVDPPSLEAFSEAIDPIISDFELLCNSAYKLESNDTIVRYNVHELVISCPRCGADVPLSKSKREMRKYLCNHCMYALHFNLEKLKDTRVVCTAGGRGEDITDSIETNYQEQKARGSYWQAKRDYSFEFIPNRRILSFSGMTTRHLFTPRNFSLLSYLADRFHDIEGAKERNAALILLTASLAQCSRLIPYRNNMTTGGPAWSVPGFWVPPMHLETNPIIHIKARYAKFLQGLLSLQRRERKGKVYIECRDALDGIQSLKERGISADVVFLDPPYGDSVPFLEFSQLWNSFLDTSPCTELDISVSDRLPKGLSWSRYSERLTGILEELSGVLAQDGRLVITFNNNDLRAWTALLKGLQANHYYCEYVTYQIPAVVSSKAQFSPKGSYISDIYGIWRHDPRREVPSVSMSPIYKALQRCALSRGGRLTQALAYRVFNVTLMKENLSHKCIDERDSLFLALFEIDSNTLTWKGPAVGNISEFCQLVKQEAYDLLCLGSAPWCQLYEAIARKVIEADIGLPDPPEVRAALEGTVLFNKDRCYLIEDRADARQKELFA